MNEWGSWIQFTMSGAAGAAVTLWAVGRRWGAMETQLRGLSVMAEEVRRASDRLLLVEAELKHLGVELATIRATDSDAAKRIEGKLLPIDAEVRNLRERLLVLEQGGTR